MQAAEIGVGIYYPIPCHRQQYVLELGIEADLPDTDTAADGCLSLPMFPLLSDADQDAVIAAFRGSVLRHAGTAATDAAGDGSAVAGAATR